MKRITLFIFTLLFAFQVSGALVDFESYCSSNTLPFHQFESPSGELIEISKSTIDNFNLSNDEAENFLWIREAAKLQLPLLKLYRERLNNLFHEISKKDSSEFGANVSEELDTALELINILGNARKQFHQNNKALILSMRSRNEDLKLSSDQIKKLKSENKKLQQFQVLTFAQHPYLSHPKIQKFINIASKENYDLSKKNRKINIILWKLYWVLKEAIEGLDQQVSKFESIVSEKVNIKKVMHTEDSLFDLYGDWGYFGQLLLSPSTDPIKKLGARGLVNAHCRITNRLLGHKAKLLISDTIFDAATLIPLISAGRFFTAGIKAYGFFGAMFSKHILPITLVDLGIGFIDTTRIRTIGSECSDILTQISLSPENIIHQKKYKECISEKNHYITKALLAAAAGMSINVRYSLRALRNLHL